jgi:raffinose/stachyose/melibiose transport system substrate-binding protein
MAGLTRRRFLRAGGGLLGAAALTPLAEACGKGSSGGGSSYSYDLWTFNAPASGANVLNKMETAYNAKSQKIALNVNAVSGSGDIQYLAKIDSLISSGQQPDLFENWIGSLSEPYIKAKNVQAVDSWFSRYGWEKILLQDAIDYVTYNGHRYGVPTALNAMPFWYNKTIFDKVGIAPPTTYAEFESINKKLAKAGYPALASGAIDGWDLMRLFEYLLEVTAGPALHDQLLDRTASWNDPAVTEAFALLKKWGDSGWIESGFLGTNPNDADSLFQSGKIAMDLTGNWEEGQLTTAGAKDSDFDVFVGPTGHSPNRLSAFAEQWQIGSHVTGAKLEALGKFLDWSIQPQQSRKYYFGSSTATIDGVPAGNVNSARILNLAKTHKTFTVMDEKLSQQLMNTYFSLADQVCSGAKTPASAAAQMEKAVQVQRA